jgi:RimJ/RimL family protein N-acetyltransferase
MDDTPILNVVGEKVGLGPKLARPDPDLHPLDQRPRHPALARGAAAAADRGAPDRLFEAGVASGDQHFDIYELATMRPVGGCDLRDIDHRNRVATMGMLIGEPEARGEGYGTEATRLLLDLAFTVHGLHSVWLTVYAYNLAGQRCYAKAGFREVGRRRQCH